MCVNKMVKPLCLLLLILGIAQNIFSQSNENPCSGGSYEVIKPFLGEWEEYRVTDSTEVYLGKLTVKLDVNGCVLSQRFKKAGSTFSYLSFGYVEPTSGLWEESYVFSTGNIAKFRWILDGSSLYTQRIRSSEKAEFTYRLLYANVQANSYEVIPQRSYDGGKTWKSYGLTRIKKLNKN